eukprot:1084736-Prymnesium_polylepis.2
MAARLAPDRAMRCSVACCPDRHLPIPAVAASRPAWAELEPRPRERIMPPQVILAIDAHGARLRLHPESLALRILCEHLGHKIGERPDIKRRHAGPPRLRNGASVVVVRAEPSYHRRHILVVVDGDVMDTRQQAVLVELLVAHCDGQRARTFTGIRGRRTRRSGSAGGLTAGANVDHDGSAKQKRLELVGVTDRCRVQELAARPRDGLVVTDEELVHQHLARVLLRHARQYLALQRADVPLSLIHI